MEICSRVIPNGLVWLAVPCTSCPLQLLHISWQQEVGDSTPDCKWPGCAINGAQSAPGCLTANDTIMLNSTNSHQIRLLLYACESRILLSVICFVICYMCIYVHIKARYTVNISPVYNDS